MSKLIVINCDLKGTIRKGASGKISFPKKIKIKKIPNKYTKHNLVSGKNNLGQNDQFSE